MIYNPEKLAETVEKLSKLYDLQNPVDFFILLPQIMESSEIRAKAFDVDTGSEKKQAVLDVILGIANKNSVEIEEDWLSVFIDIIADATKGRYAINKE